MASCKARSDGVYPAWLHVWDDVLSIGWTLVVTAGFLSTLTRERDEDKLREKEEGGFHSPRDPL